MLYQLNGRNIALVEYKEKNVGEKFRLRGLKFQLLWVQFSADIELLYHLTFFCKSAIVQ